MYQIGQKLTKQKSKLPKMALSIVILAVLIISGYFVINHRLKPSTYIKQSSGYSDTARYDYQVKEINFPIFSISVPTSWDSYTKKDDANLETEFAFKSTGSSNYQNLQLYIDKTPTKMAISRVLVVSSKVDSMSVEGTVSDKCSNPQSDEGNQNGVISKWQNVSYLCDTGNNFGTVVGITSGDSLNSVNLKSPSTGQNYKLYVKAMYSDMNPDYSQMINALKSIRVK